MKTTKKERIAILEAELKATQRELAKTKEELKKAKMMEEFYQERFLHYDRENTKNLKENEELRRDNKKLEIVIESLKNFGANLQNELNNRNNK